MIEKPSLTPDALAKASFPQESSYAIKSFWRGSSYGARRDLLGSWSFALICLFFAFFMVLIPKAQAANPATALVPGMSTATASKDQSTNASSANKADTRINIADASGESVLDEAEEATISSLADVTDEISALIDNKNSFVNISDDAQTVPLAKSDIPNVPKRSTLQNRLKNLPNDSTLSAEEQAQLKTVIEHELDVLNRYDSLKKEETITLNDTVRSREIMSDLEKALSNANQLYKQQPPAIKETDTTKVESLINNISNELARAQSNLNEATSAYNSLQTFPSRAQNQLTINNDRINEISKRIHDPTIHLLTEENEALIFETRVLEFQNNLLQNELKSLTTFQDVANYKIRIYTLQKNYLSKYLNRARAYQNRLMSAQVLNGSKDSTQSTITTPKLSNEVKSNEDLAQQIDKVITQGSQLKKDLQDIDVALNTTQQIEQSLQEQLSDLQGSVILSRLLNRQQGELPKIKISVNLDEYIPNLNLGMYDLRNYRDTIFDVQSYVDEMVQNDSTFAPYHDQLVEIIRNRRTLLDELYNAMSDNLAMAIDLRTKTNELDSSQNRVTTLINDHLFWLKSNQGMSVDFFTNLPSTLVLQVKNFVRFFTNEREFTDLLTNYLKVLFPLIIIGLAFYRGNQIIRRHTNNLALRLDKQNDNYWITPRSLITHFFLIIPRVTLITIIASVFIFISLDNFSHQLELVLLLAMHTVCFLYMRHIFEPNSLVQRHFAVPLEQVKLTRNIVDQVWFVSIPMLLIANMRELEPTKISGDIIGYLLMFLGFLYLTIFVIRTCKRHIDNNTPTLGFCVLAAVGIITPLTITVMLGLGYYYTVLQLLNRVAITLYLYFLYYIISQTLRRELYVAEIKMVHKARENAYRMVDETPKEETKTDKRNKNSKAQQQPVPKSSDLHIDLVNARAYKITDALLMCTFAYLMYIQWSDLAGVLTYLDSIYLWKSSSIVNGQAIISNALSLGDVLTALIIIGVTVILNKNLPPLIERVLLLRSGIEAKSTGYTVKLISTYIITAIGTIFAAGALGISWDNLQWLVAALSVGLGFGLQEIFANFVSGIIILFERQIRVGDIVTLNGLSGTVQKIRIRATTIMGFDYKEVVIPNRQFITSALTNWSLSNTITKLEFAIGIGYGSDIAKAKEILNSIIRRCRNLSHEKKPRVYVKSLDASCITLMCDVYVNEIGNRKDTFDFLTIESLRLFDEHNIEVPFNKLDVTVLNLDKGVTLNMSDGSTKKTVEDITEVDEKEVEKATKKAVELTAKTNAS